VAAGVHSREGRDLRVFREVLGDVALFGGRADVRCICYGVGRCYLGPSISIEQLEIGLRIVTGETCSILRETRTGGTYARRGGSNGHAIS
jgi:hypothetical protein